MSSRYEFTYVSTFAGCGGSSLGYKLAGGHGLCAIEFDANAAETYRLNFPATPVIERDICQVTIDEVLSTAGIIPRQLDILDGSPPCQGFSTAGSRKLTDPRNSLFREFVRMIEGLQPRVFVMENVSGLIKGKMRLVFKTIMETLKATGYQVRCQLLNAMYYGVPQSRERLIWIGVRPDLQTVPTFPKAQGKPITLAQACPWIVKQSTNSSHRQQWVGADRPANTVAKSGPGNDRGFCIAIDRYAIGDEWDKLKPGEKSKRYQQLVKAHPDRPCPTICKSSAEYPSAASVVHPYEKRKFTIAELKRIASFPDEFQFCGPHAQQWARIGNCVPPKFAQAIAEHIRDTILLRPTEPAPE